MILGAGLDSWALRHETLGVHVFELDQPATQQWKAARIQARLGKIPSHLTLIPIDFEREAIADVLVGQQYDRASYAFVSWLGTICYLTRGAIEATFASLAMACAPGSRVVFDYFQPKSTMSPADLQLFEELDRGGTRRGEPMQTLLDVEETARMLHSAGFRVVEDLSAARDPTSLSTAPFGWAGHPWLCTAVLCRTRRLTSACSRAGPTDMVLFGR